MPGKSNAFLREAKYLVQGPRASKFSGWDLNPGRLAQELEALLDHTDKSQVCVTHHWAVLDGENSPLPELQGERSLYKGSHTIFQTGLIVRKSFIILN